MKKSEDNIGKRLGRRLQQATATAVIKQEEELHTVAMLESTVIGLKNVHPKDQSSAQAVEDIAQQLHQLAEKQKQQAKRRAEMYAILETIVNKFRESQEIGLENVEDLIQIATVLTNWKVFVESDVSLSEYYLDTVSPQTFALAAQRAQKDKLRVISETIQKVL